MTFTRQFAVDVRDAWAGADRYQPEVWQVSLDMVFPDTPELGEKVGSGPRNSPPERASGRR